MKKISSLFALLLILSHLALLFSCREKSPPQPNAPVSDTPTISIINVFPTTIHQLSDSVTFTIQYLDGDGDLGHTNADSLSVFITDKRFPLTNSFHVPPLSPSGTAITIAGQLPVILKHIILKDANSPQETATFDIQLKDRANHYSNIVTTGPVTILP